MLDDRDFTALVDILVQADGGCEKCVRTLFQEAGKRWPERQVDLEREWQSRDDPPYSGRPRKPLDFTPADD